MERHDRKGVIIVAGGQGSRMGGDTPKQLLPIGREGMPVLAHTIRRIAGALPGANIVVVLPAAQIDRWSEISSRWGLCALHRVCAGGETRFGSVERGLGAMPECDLVAVHDGVRPLVSEELIRRVFAVAAKHGSAIPVIEPHDSFRVVEGDASASGDGTLAGFPDALPVEGNLPDNLSSILSGSLPGTASRTLDRAKLRAVQTPQVFRHDLFSQAYKTGYDPRYTDDASVWEASGQTVVLCPGERTNIKITTPEDALIAGALLDAGY